MTQAESARVEVPLYRAGTEDLEAVHVFDANDLAAIEAAIGAQRPLLLLGEPGTGKTQFARAAAEHLDRHFVSTTVDARTEIGDLGWREDLVRRLADAQMAGALATWSSSPSEDDNAARGVLDEAKRRRRDIALGSYVVPGLLWWAFNWDSALRQAKRTGTPTPPHPTRKRGGTVALIDEIDKADPDLPNGLLEAFGSRRFEPRGCDPVEIVGEPLIVIASNEERRLPGPFLRRCAVHELRMPDDGEVTALLFERGMKMVPEEWRGVVEAVARSVADDRAKARHAKQRPYPGQAEFFDLLRALRRTSEDPNDALAKLERLEGFFLGKWRHGR